jgi:5-methylcytosine-specific restriction endonuclease McrA
MKAERYKRYGRLPSIYNTCGTCHREFLSKRHHRQRREFCSNECRIAARKTGRFIACAECGVQFWVIPAREREHRTLYCSNACRVTAWNRESLARETPGSYQNNGWKVFERKCADCGYDARPEIILLHHIDGNRKNGAISNLVPLCQNCHCIRHLTMRGDARIPSARQHRAIGPEG